MSRFGTQNQLNGDIVQTQGQHHSPLGFVFNGRDRKPQNNPIQRNTVFQNDPINRTRPVIVTTQGKFGSANTSSQPRIYNTASKNQVRGEGHLIPQKSPVLGSTGFPKQVRHSYNSSNNPNTSSNTSQKPSFPQTHSYQSPFNFPGQQKVRQVNGGSTTPNPFESRQSTSSKMRFQETTPNRHRNPQSFGVGFGQPPSQKSQNYRSPTKSFTSTLNSTTLNNGSPSISNTSSSYKPKQQQMFHSPQAKGGVLTNGNSNPLQRQFFKKSQNSSLNQQNKQIKTFKLDNNHSLENDQDESPVYRTGPLAIGANNRKKSFKNLLEMDHLLTEGKNSYLTKISKNGSGAHTRIKKAQLYEAPRPTRPVHKPRNLDANNRPFGILANNKKGLRVKPNKNKGNNIVFRNKAEVYNVESYKIYNADLSKESKAQRRREALNQSCSLVQWGRFLS